MDEAIERNPEDLPPEVSGLVGVEREWQPRIKMPSQQTVHSWSQEKFKKLVHALRMKGLGTEAGKIVQMREGWEDGNQDQKEDPPSDDDLTDDDQTTGDAPEGDAPPNTTSAPPSGKKGKKRR